MGTNIREAGARFIVVCKRCKCKFGVIRNWGGGIRETKNENNNPACCPQCKSHKLEVW